MVPLFQTLRTGAGISAGTSTGPVAAAVLRVAVVDTERVVVASIFSTGTTSDVISASADVVCTPSVVTCCAETKDATSSKERSNVIFFIKTSQYFFNYIAFFSQDTSIEIRILKELRIVKKQIKNKRSVGIFGVIVDLIYKISNSIIISFYS